MLITDLIPAQRPTVAAVAGASTRVDLDYSGHQLVALADVEGLEPSVESPGVNELNRRYLTAKRQWGHRLDAEDIEPK